MSWQLRLLNSFLRAVIKPMLSTTGSPAKARKSFNLAAKVGFRTPPFTLRLDETIPSPAGPMPAQWISSGNVHPRRVILYLHGGGYIVGSTKTHGGMLAHLSRLTGVRVLAPNYRLAPESPFPSQIDDAMAAWRALMDHGYQPGDIIIGGDSAGGGLALALLSELCQNGTQPAACFALSPWTDLTLSGASLTENSKADPLLPVKRISELRDMFLQGGDPNDPRASPLFADYPNCPPVFLQGASTEILRDDRSRMAKNLTAQGVDVQLDIWGALPHVWPIFQGWLPEADEALARVAAFIRQQLPSDPPAEN